MRPVVLLVILFILAGAMVITFLPNGIIMPFAPGQYPLNQRVPTWPGKARVAPYRPGPAISVDHLGFYE